MPAPTSPPSPPGRLLDSEQVQEALQSNPNLWETLKDVRFVRKGFLITRSQDNDFLIDIIKEALTYHYPEPRGKPNFREPWKQVVPEPLKCFRETAFHLLIPKQWALYALAGTGVLNRAQNQMIPGLPLRSETVFNPNRALNETERCPQKTVVDFMETSLRKTGGAVVVSPVGTGKTVMACRLIATLRLKTLVVMGNDGLLCQWEERIKEYLPGATVGKIQGTKCEVDGNDVILGMVQSLFSHDYSEMAMRQIGLVIFDEAHHASAPAFINSLWQISCPYMVALTQNPSRKDGMTSVLYNFFSFNNLFCLNKLFRLNRFFYNWLFRFGE